MPRGGPTEVIPVVVSNIPLGTLIAERPDGRRPFTRDERLLLEAATRHEVDLYHYDLDEIKAEVARPLPSGVDIEGIKQSLARSQSARG